MLTYRVLLRSLKKYLAPLPPLSEDTSLDARLSRVLHDIFAEAGVSPWGSWEDREFCENHALAKRSIFKCAGYERCALGSDAFMRASKLTEPFDCSEFASMIIADSSYYAPEVAAPLVAFLRDIHGRASNWNLKQASAVAATAVSLHLARKLAAEFLFESSGAEDVGRVLRWPSGWSLRPLSEEARWALRHAIQERGGVPALASLFVERVCGPSLNPEA